MRKYSIANPKPLLPTMYGGFEFNWNASETEGGYMYESVDVAGELTRPNIKYALMLERYDGEEITSYENMHAAHPRSRDLGVKAYLAVKSWIEAIMENELGNELPNEDLRSMAAQWGEEYEAERIAAEREAALAAAQAQAQEPEEEENEEETDENEVSEPEESDGTYDGEPVDEEAQNTPENESDDENGTETEPESETGENELSDAENEESFEDIDFEGDGEEEEPEAEQ